MKRWMGIAAVLSLLAAGTVWAWTAPNDVRIPKVSEHPKGLPEALFSHWRHNQYQCYACHPSLFPQAPQGFKHSDMNEGRYCGHCHNGKTAWAVKSGKCGDCHVPE